MALCVGVAILEVKSVRVVFGQTLFVCTPGYEHFVELNLVLMAFNLNDFPFFVNAFHISFQNCYVCAVEEVEVGKERLIASQRLELASEYFKVLELAVLARWDANNVSSEVHS